MHMKDTKRGLLPGSAGLVFGLVTKGNSTAGQTQGRSKVSSQLTEAELAALMPSEFCQYPTPIPTQIVASDEFYPDPQNEYIEEGESRALAMADDRRGKQRRH